MALSRFVWSDGARLPRAFVNLCRIGVALWALYLLWFNYPGISVRGTVLFLAVLVIMFACVPARPMSRRVHVAAWGWWLLYALSYIVFVIVRSYCDSAGMPLQYRYGLDVGRALFGQAASARLQHLFMQPNGHDTLSLAMTVIYASFFLVPTVVALYLGRRRPEQLPRYVLQTMMVLGVGLIFFILIPTAPPWMAARDGYATGIVRIDRLVMYPATYAQALHFVGANDVAAMPSLHVAQTWLAVLAFWARGRRWRLAGTVYALVMMFAVVYLGEHWLIDALAGMVLALGVWRGLRGRTALGDKLQIADRDGDRVAGYRHLSRGELGGHDRRAAAGSREELQPIDRAPAARTDRAEIDQHARRLVAPDHDGTLGIVLSGAHIGTGGEGNAGIIGAGRFDGRIGRVDTQAEITIHDHQTEDAIGKRRRNYGIGHGFFLP